MNEKSFDVRFITPLLIGGASINGVDQNGISGKALRGCWRFWFRAIVGGILKNMTNVNNMKTCLTDLETSIFGSTEVSKFRLRIVQTTAATSQPFVRLPHKNGGARAERQGFPENTQYTITIIPRNSMSAAEVSILLAVIWLWGNLGASGNRARRGFGSPFLIERANNHIFENMQMGNENERFTLPVPAEPTFPTLHDLSNHLSTGLDTCWQMVKQWMSSYNSSNPDITRLLSSALPLARVISANPVPLSPPFFILCSFSQVACGTIPYLSLGCQPTDTHAQAIAGAIYAVHGTHACNELGRINPRMASPAFIRLHQVSVNGVANYIPTVTWCQLNVAAPLAISCARAYLNGIGLNVNLAGGLL
jgi:CRISPR type III-B/RAMP module RAMP protein Cmr1